MRTRWWTALLVGTALVGVACGSGADEAEPVTGGTDAATGAASPAGTEEAAAGEVPEDFGTLRVGFIPILGFAPFFVAQEKGYFAEEGLTVELQSFRSGDPMIAPLGAGQLDVGGGEVGPALINAVSQDFDVRIVAALASQPQGQGAVPLLVRQELLDSGEVSSVADLEGRTVALNVERGMAEFLLNSALEAEGLSIDDVEITAIPFPEHPNALANGAVDAAVLPHPLAARAIGEGIAGVLLEGDELADDPQNGVIYFGDRLIDPANREVGVRFLVAYLRAARDLQGDGWRADENVAAINTFTEVPPPAIKNGVAYFFEPDGVINRESVESIMSYHVGRGYTELDEPPALDDMVTTDFLDEAIGELGAFEG